MGHKGLIRGVVFSVAWTLSLGIGQPADRVAAGEAVGAPSPGLQARSTYNFNPGWRVGVGDPNGAEAPGFNDAAWRPVTLPYAWNEDSAFKVSIAQLPTGVAWYRKHFRLPADAADRKVFLEFEGIRQAGEFFLNGQHIGRHENGVMAVGFDITALVRPAPQENVLAVRIDNAWDYREKATNQRYQWADRNFNANYGGIPKNVRLHVTDRLYQTLPLVSNLGTTGVYVYAQDINIPARTALITAESQVRNECAQPKTFTLEVTLQDMDGKPIKTFAADPTTLGPGQTCVVRASAKVADLNFWSWGYGYLYNVDTVLKVEARPVDRVRTRTGFRKTDFSKGMVSLNDRVIQLKGYGQRTTNEWPAVGSAVPAWMSDLSNRLIVEGNGNLIRWMHVTPWKQDVESCDRVGLIQAMPAGDSEKDAAGRQWEQRMEVMRDAIVYNRNNPSILFYEAGNKGVSEEHMRQLRALRDQVDPRGGRAAGCREMLDSQAAEYGGEMLYINKSAGKPFWAMEYSRDEGLRKYWDEFSPPFHKEGDGPLYRNASAAEYNHNQDAHAIEDIVRWYDYWRERPGTGTRCSSGGVNIIFSDTNTHFRGAENFRRSGEVDALRIPKDGYWAHQVMWNGWVDVERPGIHILGHWNYRQGVRKNVTVVSSADRVELSLNGRSLGLGRQDYRFLFTFEGVEWQPGELAAVGTDASGKKVCQMRLETAAEPAAVRLTALTGPGGLKADGADMALIAAEVVDGQGRRCPTALHKIDFELAGPAQWRGGIAQGPDNHILSKTLPVECGVNRAIVRSAAEAGKITVTAKADGLRSASLEIVSRSVEVIDGLARSLPGEGLPSYLARGPTPAGPSFKVSRIPVAITGAKAGANEEKAGLSYDDVETTAWTNDNQMATAWITYELARPATLSEVTLKLPGWRQRSFPIRITVDGQEVFRGATPRSLGYVTLALRPATGKAVKIELTQASAVREATQATEVENQQNASTGDEATGRGTLSIIEIECYEAVPAGK